ncbi:hypothetical protein BDN70DRAFT_181576 [Pholiota conissans]|uniref:Uncharacterized protein n=1 Tax=Pholiota conissans TaxID=109636 RepID=A0A9P5ZCX8_9AGAR|nr:hypothetical protein BDN70DRAFT_181576 [Pholiota conissans]
MSNSRDMLRTFAVRTQTHCNFVCRFSISPAEGRYWKPNHSLSDSAHLELVRHPFLSLGVARSLARDGRDVYLDRNPRFLPRNDSCCHLRLRDCASQKPAGPNRSFFASVEAVVRRRCVCCACLAPYVPGVWIWYDRYGMTFWIQACQNSGGP